MQTELRPVIEREAVREVVPEAPRHRRRIPAVGIEFALFFMASALRFLYYGSAIFRSWTITSNTRNMPVLHRWGR